MGAIDGAWTTTTFGDVALELVEGSAARRRATGTDGATCRARVVEGARWLSSRERVRNGDGRAMETLEAMSEMCCEVMRRTLRREEEEEEIGAWARTLFACASTSDEAGEAATRATRRAAARDGTFGERLALGMNEGEDATRRSRRETEEEARDDARLALLMTAGARRAAGTLAKRAKTVDIERAVGMCDEITLREMATFVLNDLDARDAYVLRAIAARDEWAGFRMTASLLSRVARGERVFASLRALEEIVQLEYMTNTNEFVKELHELVGCLPISEGFSRKVSMVLARIIDFHSVETLLARSDSVGVVVGLQMTEYIMKSGRFMGEGNAALTRAFVDDRADVRHAAFVVATALLRHGVSVDDQSLRRAESEAKVDAILSINEIVGALSDHSTIPKLNPSAIQSLASSLDFILALDVTQKSITNRDIVRNALGMLTILSECLVVQAESARDTNGEQINFVHTDAYDDASDKPESHVLGSLLPIIEVFLDSMLCQSKWFKPLLEHLEYPEIADDIMSSSTLEAWISRLLFMHLQLSCGLGHAVPANSALSMSSCIRLLSDDAEWSQDLQGHVTRVCANILNTTQVSCFDATHATRYVSLLNTCAHQSVELLREEWFAMNKCEMHSESDSSSAQRVLEALKTFNILCETAVNCGASKGPDVDALQTVLQATFKTDELEFSSQSLVAFNKPQLGRNSYLSAGRLGAENPVAGTVALLVTSLRHQLQKTHGGRAINYDWDKVVSAVLSLLDTLLPMTAFEKGSSELVADAIIMLEDTIIKLRELPIEPTCQIASVILRHHHYQFSTSTTDCVKTASAMLKIALSYSLTSIPDELNDLLCLMCVIVSDLSTDDERHNLDAKHEAFLALASVLVKAGKMLWSHIHSKQKRLDDVEANFLALATLSLKQCTSAAETLSQMEGDENDLGTQRRNAALVLAGARLHNCTDRMSRLYDVKALGSFELERRQFMVTCASVFTNLRALQLSKTKSTPLDRSLVAIGNALAMDDIEPYSDELLRLGESVQMVDGDGFQSLSNAPSRENSASKPRKRIRNPYLDAVIAQEGGAQDEYDDMADFIVCKPGRDYRSVLGLS